jgi:hypothetical protein
VILINKDDFKLRDVRVNPKEVEVRELVDISITFKITEPIPLKSLLTIRFRGGRNNKNDWYYLQPYDPKLPGYCKLETEPETHFIPILLTGKELKISYLFYQGSVGSNTSFKFNLNNTLVQSLIEEKKKIELLIKKPNEKETICENPPIIKVKNSKFDHLTIIVPSIITPNEKLNILIRAEDKFKNLVEDFNSELKTTLIPKTENLTLNNQISFPKGTDGVLSIKEMTIEEPGFYKIQITVGNESFFSNPFVCKKKSSKRLYWGFIHGHTNKSDGMLSIEDYFANMVKAGLDFGASTEHDHIWETSDDDFNEIKRTVQKFQKEGEFITFFGYEWGYWYTGYGDICIYFSDDTLPIFRSDTNKYNSTEKLIKNLKPYKGKVLMVGHHTALRPGYRNWEYVDDSLERLVEIYSTWGNQENSSLDGNPLPPRYKFFGYGDNAIKRGPLLEKKGSFVQDALLKGHKLGFTAGGDDHFGVYPSGAIDPDNGIYPPGIMAVWADKHIKSSLWNALYNRKCYGSTGPRIIMEFFIDEYSMGDCIELEFNSKLRENREISIGLISPLTIERVEIVRNNEIAYREDVNSDKFEELWTDSIKFDHISLLHSNKQERFIFYYLRVILEAENMAWTSPIWITQNLDEKI